MTSRSHSRRVDHTRGGRDFFGSLTFVTEIAPGLSFLLGLFVVLGGLGGAL
jgi:hypothetical protein